MRGRPEIKIHVMTFLLKITQTIRFKSEAPEIMRYVMTLKLKI